MNDERGVYDMKHRSMNGGHLWAYAANSDGHIIKQLEYGEGTRRTHEQAVDELWDALDTEDPEPGHASRVLPFPLLCETFGELHDGSRFRNVRLSDT